VFSSFLSLPKQLISEMQVPIGCLIASVPTLTSVYHVPHFPKQLLFNPEDCDGRKSCIMLVPIHQTADIIYLFHLFFPGLVYYRICSDANGVYLLHCHIRLTVCFYSVECWYSDLVEVMLISL